MEVFINDNTKQRDNFDIIMSNEQCIKLSPKDSKKSGWQLRRTVSFEEVNRANIGGKVGIEMAKARRRSKVYTGAARVMDAEVQLLEAKFDHGLVTEDSYEEAIVPLKMKFDCLSRCAGSYTAIIAKYDDLRDKGELNEKTEKLFNDKLKLLAITDQNYFKLASFEADASYD